MLYKDSVNKIHNQFHKNQDQLKQFNQEVPRTANSHPTGVNNGILIETDCPYLTPPKSGAERNEPIFVKYVAERIAELRSITFQEVAEKTTKNARKLFKI